MDSLYIMLVALVLLRFAATQVINKEDDVALDLRDSALFNNMTEVSQTLKNMEYYMQESLRLHRQNSDALRDLLSIPNMVQYLNIKLDEYLLQVKEPEQKVNEVNNTVNTLQGAAISSEECGDYLHLQDIKDVVQDYINTNDWYTLVRGLEIVVDNNSDVYSQLQDTGSVFRVGFNGHVKLALLLLCGGLPVDAAEPYMNNMLHGAAYKGHLQLVDLLLDRGADVEAKNKFGFTPLMLAARGGHLEVAKRLVQAGADTTAKDNSVSTALDKAKIYNRSDVIQYLEAL